jgi:hypothetical protein
LSFGLDKQDCAFNATSRGRLLKAKPFSVFEQLYEDVDPKMIGEGGAPTRATILPVQADERKKFPIASGVLDYFPDALAALAYLSYKGNEQHNPGQSLRWARDKSGDESDTMLRHFLQRGTLDTDGVPHSVKMAWRALAILQKELESKQS